jgi:hypothetical protein
MRITPKFFPHPLILPHHRFKLTRTFFSFSSHLVSLVYEQFHLIKRYMNGKIIIISNQHHISRNVNVSPFITILLKHFLTSRSSLPNTLRIYFIASCDLSYFTWLNFHFLYLRSRCNARRKWEVSGCYFCYVYGIYV